MPAFRRGWFLVVAVVAACVTPAGSVARPPPSPSAAASAVLSNTGSALPSPTGLAIAPVAVEFSASDGVPLQGRLFGAGRVGVVLAHGLLGSVQFSWNDFAPRVAARGYLTLTFNFRSLEEADRGLLWKDVLGAIQFLQDKGAEHVVLVGASLGAHWVLWAAGEQDVAIDGAVDLSGGPTGFVPEYDLTAERMAMIHVPLLFVTGSRDDVTSEASVRELYKIANKPKSITVLDSPAHGASLVSGSGSVPDQARGVIFDFIETVT